MAQILAKLPITPKIEFQKIRDRARQRAENAILIASRKLSPIKFQSKTCREIDMSPFIANCLLLLAGLLWGVGFIAQETAMDDIGPMLFLGLRFILAAAVVAPFALLEQRRGTDTGDARSFGKRDLAIAVGIGCIFFSAMAPQQIGLVGTTVTNAGFLTGLYVVIVPIVLLAVWSEKQLPVIWLGAALSIFGVWLLSGGDFSTLNWGDGLVFIGAIFWAFHVIFVGKAVRSIGRPVRIATIQFATCGVLALLFHFIFRLIPLTATIEPAFNLELIKNALPEILYAALIAGGLAFTLQAVAQRHTSDAAAAILLSSESLFAAMFGALLLSERLTITGYIGCALIFFAIILVQIAPMMNSKRHAISNS